MKLFKFLISSLFIPLILLGCANKEGDAISLAQNCLDQIPPDDGSQALRCIEFIEGFSSQGSDIIRCSAYFMSGGLTTRRIVDAFKKLENNDDDRKESLFISLLALDSIEVAQNADLFCKRTGLATYSYLSNLAVIGTTLQTVFGGGRFSDLTEEELKEAVQETLEGCQGNGSNAELISNCQAQAQVLAGSAVELSNSYCTTEKRKEEKVCQDIQGAIAASDGTNEQITAALFCLLDKKTFVDGACN